MNGAFCKKGMHSYRSFLMKILYFSIFFFMFRRNAYAYIDPGSGEYILQLLLAGLGGILFLVVRLWSRLRIFLFHKNTHGEARAQR
jgi:hypothetical protein